MKQTTLRAFRVIICMVVTLLINRNLLAQQFRLQTRYAVIGVNNKGFITSIKDRRTGKEYNPTGMSSPLMSLEKTKQAILPVKAVHDTQKKVVTLTFSNG